MNELLKPLPFIINEDNGKKKILQSKLVNFLEANGFNQVSLDGELSYVRVENKIIRKISIVEIVSFLRQILEKKEYAEAFDVFAQNSSRYVSRANLLLLNKVEPADDKDSKNLSRFFYENCYCEITSDSIVTKDYNSLDITIWKNRIIQRSYVEPKNNDAGQFEQFCTHITGNDPERLNAMKSFLGYLLHRNKERGENKAVILYDELMGVGDRANGRTGKTLLGQAIEQCREYLYYDGKNSRFNGNFIYQRINSTTDVVFYDDLPKNASFENFYSFLTTGIEVEQKYKKAFYIKGADSPKLMISSNYYVKGDGGSSDLARRYEFEIINYYDQEFTPEQEFGNRFFGDAWHTTEWNKFFNFMMKCIQTYLRYGLIEAKAINLQKNKIVDLTSKDFLDFADVFFALDVEMDKRKILADFQLLFPRWKKLSSNKFTRWCKSYANHIGAFYGDKSSGGDLLFWFNSENRGDE